jgi:hypothetical protein
LGETNQSGGIERRHGEGSRKEFGRRLAVSRVFVSGQSAEAYAGLIRIMSVAAGGAQQKTAETDFVDSSGQRIECRLRTVRGKKEHGGELNEVKA